MPPKIKTLDISELQLLIQFPEDDDGLYWHHRIGLLRLSGDRWVMLTPDHEFEVHDFKETSPGCENYKLLSRNTDFPASIYKEVYAHDPISDDDLRRFKKEARAYKILLGDEGPVEEREKVWVICDTRDSHFGKAIPEDKLDDDGEPGVCDEDKGVVLWDGAHRFCEQVAKDDVDSLVLSWKPGAGDSRILPVLKDGGGKRNRSLREAVGAYSEHDIEDWPHSGPRAFLEFSRSVSASADSWVVYHSEWIRNSGVGAGTAPAHEHRILCEYMRLSHQVDQINGPNLAGTELLTRRMVQIEMAVERCPRSPDYAGLGCILAGPTSESGAAITRDFTEWVSNKQKERAGVLKQQRLIRDETTAERKR